MDLAGLSSGCQEQIQGKQTKSVDFIPIFNLANNPLLFFQDSLVSQAIKKKLSMRTTHSTSSKSDSKGKRPLAAQDDEEKAKLLFGAIMFPNSKKK